MLMAEFHFVRFSEKCSYCGALSLLHLMEDCTVQYLGEFTELIFNRMSINLLLDRC